MTVEGADRPTLIIPRECRGSSTPRLLDSIIGVSGIWVARSSRAMTAEIVLATLTSEVLQEFLTPPNQRAQGRPGARRTRGPAGCCKRDMLPTSIQVWRIHTGLPCAMALRLIRDRPGDPAFCDTIALGPRWRPSNLTPASGRRTQTISPYARAALVSRCLASTAPCPSFATMANAPLMGQDGGSSTSDFPNLPAIYFRRHRIDLYLA